MTILLEQPIDATLEIEHWDNVARAYAELDSPLRPCAEDTAAMSHFIRQIDGEVGGQGVNALLWGVTPAVAKLQLPKGSHLLAIDRSSVMVDQVWPGDRLPHRMAKCAEWLEPQVADHTYDVVLGDGSFNCMAYPAGYHQLAAVTGRALQPDGALIARFFVKPAQAESVDTVFRALMRGQIGSFHAFKWHLMMAMLGATNTNIALSDVWDVWQQAKIDYVQLQRVTGWPAAAIQTIHYYQHSEAQISFPTLAQVQHALADLFDMSQVYTPTYELGERCPTILFRPKQTRPISIED